jgi:hypothetical protein
MPSKPLTLYNPFNLQRTSEKYNRDELQKIAYYGESRFRAILIAICCADGSTRLWMQKVLLQEFVSLCSTSNTSTPDIAPQNCIISYIGRATAVGICIDIPIIVRSLADCLLFADEEDLPLPIHASLRSFLSTGTDPNEHGRLVASYRCDWWTKPSEPAADQICSHLTLGDCLAHYRQELCAELDPGKRRPVAPIPLPNHPTIPQLGEHKTTASEAILWRNRAATLQQDLTNIRQLTAGLQTAIQTHGDLDIRRANSYFALHKKALSKQDEQNTSASAQTPSGTVPPASPKWPLGPNLTEKDILDIKSVHPNTNKRQIHHSSHDSSLPTGFTRPTQSSYPNTVTSVYSLTSDAVIERHPINPLDLPTCFQ